MSTKAKWEEHHNRTADVHAQVAAHHEHKDGSHAKKAEAYSALHKTTGHKEYAAIAEAHRSDSAQHKADGIFHRGEEAYHRSEADKCSKMIESDFEKRSNQLVPTGVSGVTPGVRAVPRPGQQPIAKANVPTEFSHLFTTEDEREAS
jgi:hypothetical protein